MINQEQAEAIVAEFVGAPADDTKKGRSLEEFGDGWLILDMILADYSEVADEGYLDVYDPRPK